MIITTNPWINANTFRDFTPGEAGPKMSVDGAITKTVFLLACLVVGVSLTFLFPDAGLAARAVHPTRPSALYTALHLLFWPGFLAVILSFIGFIAWFFERAQVYLAPIFALVEGMCLCSLALVSNEQWPGLGLMALAATVSFVAVVIVAYWLGLVGDTPPWKLGLAAAFFAVAASFGAMLVLRELGQEIELTGHIMIVYWAGVIGIVAYMGQQLALSFKYIEDAADVGAPRWMEWRAAYGLLVTLVWIFIVMFNIIKAIRAATRDSRNAAFS